MTTSARPTRAPDVTFRTVAAPLSEQVRDLLATCMAVFGLIVDCLEFIQRDVVGRPSNAVDAVHL